MLIHVVPGDPVQIMYAQSQGTTPEQLEEVRHRLGLDRPLIEQYVMYMGRILQGDFGKTIRGEQPVLDLLLLRLPYTLVLAATALAIAAAIGLTCGFFAAYKRGTPYDTGLMIVAIFGVSIPHFWLGLILLFVFAVNLTWLPVAGSGPENLVLPAVTLGITNAAIIARLTRSSMIDVFSQDFIRTAKAKGMPKAIVLYRHALRSGLVPIITMMGLQFTYMMGGAIVVENVFALPGLGRLIFQAVSQRDIVVVRDVVMLLVALVVVVNFIVDIAYGLIDPRPRTAV